ncbi:MAG: hypothetical protein ACHQ7N_10570 [Candidatus Methylomirabilales bacterium]
MRGFPRPLSRLSKGGHLQVYAWALMPDHFRLWKGDNMVADERILGGADFVEGLLAEAAERIRQTLRVSRPAPDLSALARKVSRREVVTEAELRSGSRRQCVSKARTTFCRLTVAQLGCSGAEGARFLGVTTSAVHRTVGRKVGSASEGRS